MYDWPGENHAGEITEEIIELLDDLLSSFTCRFFLTQKTKKTEKSKNEIPQI